MLLSLVPFKTEVISLGTDVIVSFCTSAASSQESFIFYHKSLPRDAAVPGFRFLKQIAVCSCMGKQLAPPCLFKLSFESGRGDDSIFHTPISSNISLALL